MSNALKFLDSKSFKKQLSSGTAAAPMGVRKQYIAEEIKASSDPLVINFTISTGAVDRDSDTVSPSGWQLDNFKRAPSVLFAHDQSKPPVAKAKKTRIEDGKLKSSAEFMPKDMNEFSFMIYRMLKEGFLHATSVGFLPLEYKYADEGEEKGEGTAKRAAGSIDFIKQELLEFSVVPVPSNPEALIEARSAGINTEPLGEWFEEALDQWAEYKDMLLVPRAHVEKIAKCVQPAKSRTFHMSKAQQDKLLAENLAALKAQTNAITTHVLTVPSIEEVVKTAEPETKTVRTTPRIAARIFDRPLLMHPGKLGVILSALSEKISIDPEAVEKLMESADEGDFEGKKSKKPYKVQDGIATIPIIGSLAQRTSGFDAMSGMMTYDDVDKMLTSALADDDVKAIALEIDSPGGEASAVFDLSDRIYESRGTKPIWGVVNDMAFSAAYAIASACDNIVVSRTGGVGSVGVVCMHVDQSVALHNEGVKVTFIHAGDKKVEGNSYTPLSDEAKDNIQAETDRIYDIFVKTVARNLGMEEKRVRKTQAECFFGDKAVEVGFAHEVLSTTKAYHKMAEILQKSVEKQAPAEENDEVSTENLPMQVEDEIVTVSDDADSQEDNTEPTPIEFIEDAVDNASASDEGVDLDLEVEASTNEDIWISELEAVSKASTQPYDNHSHDYDPNESGTTSDAPDGHGLPHAHGYRADAEFTDVGGSDQHKHRLEAIDTGYDERGTEAEEEPIKLKIISDGTSGGTKVVDAKSGRTIEGIKSVNYSISMDSLPKAEIHVEFAEAEIELVEPTFTVDAEEEIEIQIDEPETTASEGDLDFSGLTEAEVASLIQDATSEVVSELVREAKLKMTGKVS